jgi:hypothetical protein
VDVFDVVVLEDWFSGEWIAGGVSDAGGRVAVVRAVWVSGECHLRRTSSLS